MRDMNPKMAEMQKRLIHLLRVLMEKGIVMTCVSDVMGVVEERQRDREVGAVGRELRRSVDALTDEMTAFMTAAHRLHLEAARPVHVTAEEREAKRDESIISKIEDVRETIVKIPDTRITVQVGNLFYNRQELAQTIIIGNKMTNV